MIRPGRRSLVLSGISVALALTGGRAFAAARRIATPTAFFNVRDFGAVGDGKVLDTPAINRAIDAAAVKGGGTVYVPAGFLIPGKFIGYAGNEPLGPRRILPGLTGVPAVSSNQSRSRKPTAVRLAGGYSRVTIPIYGQTSECPANAQQCDVGTEYLN